jgi:hypothetical protein
VKERRCLRSKWSDANTSTNQQNRLILQEILASASERTINHDPGQDLANRRDNNVSLLLRLVLRAEITSTRLGKSTSEVTDDPNMHAQVIFLGSGGEREGVPLEVRNLGARDEDVLTSSDGGLLLLNLELHDLGRVLNDFGNVSPMTRSDFTQDPFGDPNQSTDEPIALRSNSVKAHSSDEERERNGPRRHRCYCKSSKAACRA